MGQVAQEPEMDLCSLVVVSAPAAQASQGLSHLEGNGPEQFQPFESARGAIWQGGVEFSRAIQLGFKAGHIASLDGEQDPSGCPS